MANALPAPLDEDNLDDASFRALDRAWSCLAGLFDELESTQGLTYEQLAQRIERTPEEVRVWLKGPADMSLEALGLLAAGMDAELTIELVPREERG